MRSFCAGFSSTFYLADSPAFVTSAFSPTGVVPHCCLFAGRSYWCVPSSRRQRLRQPRFCGNVLAVKARCALSSASQRTSFTNANIPRLHALTARSDRSLTPPTAPPPRREATSVSVPQNHPLRRPSCCVRMGDFCSLPRLQRHSPLNRFLPELPKNQHSNPIARGQPARRASRFSRPQSEPARLQTNLERRSAAASD